MAEAIGRGLGLGRCFLSDHNMTLVYYIMYPGFYCTTTPSAVTATVCPAANPVVWMEEKFPVISSAESSTMPGAGVG